MFSKEVEAVLRKAIYDRIDVVIRDLGETVYLNATDGLVLNMEDGDIVVKVTFKKERVDTEKILSNMAKTAEKAAADKATREKKRLADEARRAKATAEKEALAREFAEKIVNTEVTAE